MREDMIEHNRESMIALLQETGREGIDCLVEWLDKETDYFTAPASSRPGYHGCHEGGLAEHSLNVYTLFEQKVRQFNLDVKPDEIVIASLLHDACKIGQYQPNVLKSGALSEAKPYVIEDDFPLGHGEKSVYVVSQHFALTQTEVLLMRWHMGPFDEAWEQWEPRVGKACPSVYAFHDADMEASKYLDVRG
ncbi:HD domain-containing protein [Candidatus Woesearchaeota archaeon]|nr:HD domain-containing protein [Candidatus Woesearchaeota archaeon]